jgi:Rad3-related DNA helicase
VASNSKQGVEIKGTYGYVNSFDYQDSVGQILLSLIPHIPGGVLVFFSSYSAMHTLTARWRKLGILDHLSDFKQLFFGLLTSHYHHHPPS